MEIDTSHLQGSTEGVLQRQNSNASLHKMGSVRNSNQDECSLQDISFSHTESTKEQTAKQADFYHNAGWEARKRQDFQAAIEFYTKAI